MLPRGCHTIGAVDLLAYRGAIDCDRAGGVTEDHFQDAALGVEVLVVAEAPVRPDRSSLRPARLSEPEPPE